MEVASPPAAPFGHASNRAKRHFPGSPSPNRNPFAMIPGDASDEYMQQRSFKRRRFAAPDESMGAGTENNQNHSFMQFHHQPIVAKRNSIPLSAQGKSTEGTARGPLFLFVVTSGLLFSEWKHSVWSHVLVRILNYYCLRQSIPAFFFTLKQSQQVLLPSDAEQIRSILIYKTKSRAWRMRKKICKIPLWR